MRKLLLFSLLALGASFSAQAQNNVIKTGVFDPIIRQFSLSYERVLGEKTSVQLRFSYNFGFDGIEDDDPNTARVESWDLDNSIEFAPEFRYYPASVGAPRGFYLGPWARYRTFNFTYNNDDFEGDKDSGVITGLGGGLLLGGQWLFGDKIALDVYGGPGYMTYGGSVNADDDEVNASESNIAEGFVFRFGLNVGFAF